MAIRSRLAPGLGAVAALTLVGADVVWWRTSRSAARCAGGSSINPVAVALAVASAGLVVASLVVLLNDWVRQSVAGQRLRRGRALTITLAVFVLLGVVVSIVVMTASQTLQLCF